MRRIDKLAYNWLQKKNAQLVDLICEKLDNYTDGLLMAKLVKIDTRILAIHREMMEPIHPYRASEICGERIALKRERRKVQTERMRLRKRRIGRGEINCTKG